MVKKKAQNPTTFTQRDVKRLLEDLKLYSGNIRDIKIHGKIVSGMAHVHGAVCTWMDEFEFDAFAALCTGEFWSIQLPDTVASLRRGHRSLVAFTFPKLHKNPELQKRYRVANLIYSEYNGRSGFTEADRLKTLEKLLGYEMLPTYTLVLEQIIKDFRSYTEKKLDAQKAQISKN